MSDKPFMQRAGTDTATRRTFVKGVGVAGGALLGLGASTGRATAASSSWNILDGTDHETTVHRYDSGEAGPTTLVVGGMHGDERSGHNAAHDIATWGVDVGELYVIPEANTVGVERLSRECDHGDLNRAFPATGGDCDNWVADRIWEEVLAIDPDWAFDLHASFGIYSEDTGVGQAMFPTWTSPARSYGENTVTALNDSFGLKDEMQYTMGNTLDADRPMLMHRIAGVLDRPGYICETYRGDGTSLDEQVAWQKFSVEYTMNQYGQTTVRDTSDGTSDGTSDPTWEAWPITVDDPWQTFDLHFDYTDPVVIPKSLSYVGPDPAHTRLRNVSGGSFDCRIEEWDYLNDYHYQEQTGMLTIERGTHTYQDGTKVQAGSVVTDGSWSGVSFDHSFDRPPVVLAKSQTTNGSDPIVSRISNVSTDGFSVRVQEEEYGTGHGHANERIGYVAVQQGTGKLGPKPFEAGIAPSVTDAWADIAFEGSYSSPVFLCGVQSYEGNNPSGARVARLDGQSAAVVVEEEQSDDDEMFHLGEQIGYLVIED